jgi:hypothetical protein
VADEKGFVDRDVFKRFDVLAFFHLQDTVHQQKWVAVRQGFQDLVNVHHGGDLNAK